MPWKMNVKTGKKPIPPEERIKIDPVTNCHEWQGGGSVGYGHIRRGDKIILAHNYFWEKKNGPIPSDLFVDHLCRNRKCCNPEHMELVTERENILRGTSKGALNARKTHCPYGHEYTEDNIYTAKTKSGFGRICRECTLKRVRKSNLKRRWKWRIKK